MNILVIQLLGIKKRKMEEEDREITAYHEAGHAVVAARLDNTDRPHKVTIVPRGRALGATMILPDKESYHMQKKRLKRQLPKHEGPPSASRDLTCA